MECVRKRSFLDEPPEERARMKRIPISFGTEYRGKVAPILFFIELSLDRFSRLFEFFQHLAAVLICLAPVPNDQRCHSVRYGRLQVCFTK